MTRSGDHSIGHCLLCQGMKKPFSVRAVVMQGVVGREGGETLIRVRQLVARTWHL